MAFYPDTPGASERGDFTLQNAHETSFSMVQPFSAAKRRDNDILQDMRSQRGGMFKTPRARNALLDRRNPGPSKNEFTPLLKSAAANRFRSHNSFDDKENGNTSSFYANGAPRTPAYLKTGAIPEDESELPQTNTFVDGEDTRSSTGEMTPVAPQQVASSSIMSTPIPALPQRENGIVDQGNVLTLREQEAVSFGYSTLS